MEEQGDENIAAFEFQYSTEDNDAITNGRSRAICSSGCGRPSSVCLCEQLPPTRLSTKTQILILHHPHELRHKLSTVPLLSKSLLNVQTLVGRHLRLGFSPLLDSLYHYSSSSRPHALFLFPGTDSFPSVDLHDWAASNLDQTQSVVLIVFDGTWKHAKEMVSASLPFLSKFAVQVSLTYDLGFDGESAFDSDLVLRKEPFLGCVSTIEAVARSLRVLETDGIEIEERLLSILRAMARFQSCHFKPQKPRLKLSKKGKEKKNNNKKKGIELQLLDQ